MNRINIFGSSERLEELGDKGIKRILALKSPSIGINMFINRYPEVDYFCFTDSCTLDKVNYQGQKIITNRFINNMYLKKDPKYNIECIFEPNHIPESIANSAFFAIWYAVKQGYKNIHLYGILDGDYIKLANGEYSYKHMYEKGTYTFQHKRYSQLLNIVETGYFGKANIVRPLLKEKE